MTRSGCSITVKQERLVAWAKEMIADHDRLDVLMKSAYAAALALCPESALGGPTMPYR